MLTRLFEWWYGFCGWHGHDFKFDSFVDSEEFVGRDWMDDCVRVMYRCSRCEAPASEFLCWGTVEENKDGLATWKQSL